MEKVKGIESELVNVVSKARKNSLERTLRKHWVKIRKHMEALDG